MEKQYQKLDKIHGRVKNLAIKEGYRSNLVYNNFNFDKFSIRDEDFNELFD